MSALDQKGIAHLFLIVLLLAGIGLGIYLVQNRTNIFPRAASGPINPRTAFSFSTNTFSVPAGETIDVRVTMSSDFDAANTFKAKVYYIPDDFELIAIKPGLNDATSSGSFIQKWIEQTEGPLEGKEYFRAISLVGAVPNPGFKTTPGNEATMATLTFKAKRVGESVLGFVFGESAIYRNSDNQNILQTTDERRLRITPAPSAIPSVDSDGDGFLDGDELFYGTDPKKACGINAWPPDLNNDAAINGGDVSALVPYTSGAQPYNKRFDLNMDGKINELDASVIQKYFLKTCSGAPSCSTTRISSTATVNSNSQVTWTYKYDESTKINRAIFKATPGVTWKVGNDVSQPGGALDVAFIGGMNPITFSAITSTACSAFTGQFTLINNCGNEMANFVGMGSASAWGQFCGSSAPSGTPNPTPPPVSGKRADLYNDPKKPNFINDQDVSVFYTKCSADGLEFFGKPASVQPICDILEDGKITVQDWAVLIKFRNQTVQ
jgi:hypothetical protein